MIDDPRDGLTGTPGNRGRKSPPVQTGFLTLPPSRALDFQEQPDEDRDRRRDHQVNPRHRALLQRLSVDRETRSWPAALRADR